MVLNQDHRHAAIGQSADQRDQVLDLAMGQTGGRLIEQQQLWPQREGASNLQPPLVAEGQVARLLIGEVGQADDLEQHAGVRASIAASSRRKRGKRNSVVARPAW